jgi:hypothetical protein
MKKTIENRWTSATGLEAKGPRYHDLPVTALDGMDDKK